MGSKDMILVASVFFVCLAIVGYLFFTGTKDTGVNEVIDKYTKIENKVKILNYSNNNKKILANLAVKYKDKLEKAVQYLNENSKALAQQELKFKLKDIDDAGNYIVLFLKITTPKGKTFNQTALLSKNGSTLLLGNIIPIRDIAKRANYTINLNGLKTKQDIANMIKELIVKINPNVKINSIKNITENKGLLVILFNITIENNTVIQPVVLTTNGKYLIGNVIPLDINKKIEPPKPPEPPKQEPIPKSKKPKVIVFVMSYCPFGVQMERALLPVIDLFKNKVDFEIKFVDYAMHGKKEIDEDLRQYCIQKINKEEYWKYLKCFIKTGNYSLCLKNISIDLNELNKCMNETDALYNVSYYRDNKSTYLNGIFPKFLVNEQENKKYGVQGSPTTFINGVEYVGPRSPEAIKEAICNAFEKKPEECNVTLSKNVVPYGIGEVGQGSGSCG